MCVLAVGPPFFSVISRAAQCIPRFLRSSEDVIVTMCAFLRYLSPIRPLYLTTPTSSRYVLQLLENVASVPNDVAATLYKGSKGGSEIVDSLLHIMDSASNDQVHETFLIILHALNLCAVEVWSGIGSHSLRSMRVRHVHCISFA
jgi:hypothetical protein